MVSRQPDKNTTQVRVYKYGLVPQGYVPKQAVDELFRANALWNRLVELHNQNWQEFEDARSQVSEDYKIRKDEIAEISVRLDKAYDERRGLRTGTGSMASDDPKTKIIDKQISELKAGRGKKYQEQKTLRGKIDKLIDKVALDKKRKDEFKRAVRKDQSGLVSQTAEEVRRDFDNARDRLIKKPGSGRLRFHRFDGTGYWNFRFRSDSANFDGVNFDELFQGNRNRERAFSFLSRDDSHKRPRLRLKSKLAGGAKKDSKIFHEFDVILHRPIPEDSKIQNGKILRTRVGDKFRYDLVLTVKSPKSDAQIMPTDNAIGIDIGWRQHETDKNLLQVLSIASLDGSLFQEINLPNHPISQSKGGEAKKSGKTFIQMFDYIDDVKTKLDENATKLGKDIKPLLKQVPTIANFDRTSSAPDEPEQRQSYYFIKQCASVVRLPANVTLSFETAYKLATAINRLNRLPNNEISHLPDDVKHIITGKIGNLIIRWWDNNSRLYREQHNLRAKEIGHRKDYYRQIAAELVSHKLLLCIESNFLAKISETKDKDNKLTKTARHNRVLASNSSFISALENAALREGIALETLDSNKNTSKTCFDCGEVNKALESEKEWRCPHCGVSHDRDENAAKNIAQKGLEQYKRQSQNNG